MLKRDASSSTSLVYKFFFNRKQSSEPYNADTRVRFKNADPIAANDTRNESLVLDLNLRHNEKRTRSEKDEGEIKGGAWEGSVLDE